MKSKIRQTVPWLGKSLKVGHYPMVFDKSRNQFYWELLKQCKDQICIEVGFGTGILTLMALERGAKFIHAYEEDPNIFELGKHVIKSVDKSNRVNFYNEKYKSKYHGVDTRVVYHEIIGKKLWNEGIRDTFRFEPSRIIPSKLSCNVRLFEGSVNQFPGVDDTPSTGIDYLDNKYLPVLKDLWENQNEIVMPDHSYPSGRIVNQYTYDINSYIPEVIELDLDVNNGIVFVEYYLNDFRLTSGHWREDKSIKVDKHKTKFYQDTISGEWWLE